MIAVIAALPDAIGQAVAQHLPQQMTLRETVREVQVPVNLPVLSVDRVDTIQNIRQVEVEKPSPKLQKALDWLADHPADMDLSNRELANKLEISHGWVGKAKRIIRGEE